MKCLAVFVALVLGACAGAPPVPQARNPNGPRIELTCNLSPLERAIDANVCVRTERRQP